jgi:hypothetical protein
VEKKWANVFVNVLDAIRDLLTVHAFMINAFLVISPTKIVFVI